MTPLSRAIVASLVVLAVFVSVPIVRNWPIATLLAVAQNRLPTADGAFAQAWFNVGGTQCDGTACWDEVSDSNDATYVKQTAGNFSVTFEFTDFAIQSTAIQNVTVNARCVRTAAGDGNLNVYATLIVNGGDYYAADPWALTTTITNFSYPFTTNPATTIGWTEDQVEGLVAETELQEIGLTASGWTTLEEARCHQVSVDVNYTAAVAGGGGRFTLLGVGP